MGDRLLRVLAWLVPPGKRNDWLREWRAERFCAPGLGTLLAAGEDALRLRVHRQHRHHGWRPSSFGSVVDDFRSAALRLWRAPVFTLAAVLTLALTIGANTAVLSVADAVLFRPLPYTEPDRVFVLGAKDRRTSSYYTSIPAVYVEALGRGLRALGPLAEHRLGSLVVPGDDDAERVGTITVSANYFDVLGVTAARGRTFVPEDAAQPGRAAMLSHAAWQQRFGGDEEVVGRSIALADATFDIVGILPAGFVFPDVFARNIELVTVLDPAYSAAAWSSSNLLARLEPGVTRAQAQAEIDVLAATIAAAHPDEQRILVLRDVRAILYSVGRPIMALLLVAAAVVLLIGCANLANLLLGRTRRRRHETGVRAALGAPRARLVRPLLFEAMMLGTCGAALAVLMTWWGFDVLARQIPARAYRDAPIGVDLRVASLTFLLGLLAGLLFAAVPAWRAARTDPDALIRGKTARTGAGNRYVGRPMIIAQVALSVVVVFGAVVAGRAFIAVLQVPLGFVPDNVITVAAQLPYEGDETADLETRWTFFTEALATLAQRPEVVSASAVRNLPLDGTVMDYGVRLPGSGVGEGWRALTYALPGYWETVGIRLLRGRLPSWDDVDGGSSAAILSESAAQSWFGGRDPLGAVLEEHTGRRLTVVGVVEDVVSPSRLESRPVEPLAYALPQRGHSMPVGWLLVRVRSRGNPVLTAIRNDIVALTPYRTVVVAGWWRDSLSAATPYRNPRFQALVLGGFGVLALMLTGLGIFAAVAFLVVIRAREMGIRGALGATPRSLVGTMVRHATVPIGLGLLIGLVATRGVARLAEAQIFDVEAGDPVAYGAVLLAVFAMALLAAWIPARRASRVDPVVALRAE